MTIAGTRLVATSAIRVMPPKITLPDKPARMTPAMKSNQKWQSGG